MSAVLLAVALCGAFAETGAQSQPSTEMVVDWFRVYSTAPYREYWNLTIFVKDAAKGIPRVMKAMEVNGGQLMVPLQNAAGSLAAATQQLSYRAGRKGAQAALKELKKIGQFAPPAVRLSGELPPIAEIKSKIAALSHDKQAHAAELAAMPAVAALVDAVLGHLVTVRAVVEKKDIEVVFNITVQGPDPR